MNTTRLPAGIAGGLLALVVAVAGCGSTGTAPTAPAPAGSAAAEAGAQFNDADVAFARMMIPHHREAVEMADLAADRAQNPDVKALAEQIRAAQEPEIDQLTGLLTNWGTELADEDPMPGMDHGNMPGTPTAMPGAMAPEQMEELRNTSGAEFDQLFLTMMIEHHRSAVRQAQQEVDQGSNPDAKQLAEKIVADQSAEITRMRTLQSG